MNKGKLFILTAVFGLLVNVNVALAATVEINDGFYAIYDPETDYPPFTLMVGGTEIFTFGFGFIDPNHRFIMDIYMPLSFIGEMEWLTSAGPDGAGQTFAGGALSAGESISIVVAGSGASSPQNPVSKYLSFQALDMPPLSSMSVNSPVPVPAAAWLFGSGLLGLIGVARRRNVTV